MDRGERIKKESVCLCKRENEGVKEICALLFIAVLSTSSTKYKKSHK